MDVPPSDIRMGPHQGPGATAPAALSPTLAVRPLPSTMTADAVRTLWRVDRTEASRPHCTISATGQGQGVERARSIGRGRPPLYEEKDEHARRNSSGECSLGPERYRNRATALSTTAGPWRHTSAGADCGEPLAGNSGTTRGAPPSAAGETTHASYRCWWQNTSQDRAIEHQSMPCVVRDGLDSVRATMRRVARQSGRVPGVCGYSSGTSPKPPASSDSAGHEPSKSVFNPSLAPLGLHLSTPSLSTS